MTNGDEQAYQYTTVEWFEPRPEYRRGVWATLKVVAGDEQADGMCDMVVV